MSEMESGHETILVVEDNTLLREGLRDILAMEGYHVLCAANGVEALELMQTLRPNLILSDIAMPHMDGFAFFEAVRAQLDWLTIPLIFLTARGEKEDMLKGKNLGAEDYLVKPLSRDELLTAVRGRLARAREIEVGQLQRAYEASLTALANSIDVRDVYTRGHIERVTAYSMAFAAHLGWTGRKLEQMRFAAILHDIGMIFVPESILFKIEPLTEAEWQHIRLHPVAGARMLEHVPYLSPAIPIVRHHHERWDGQGYPDGIAGEQIPIEARLMTVADSFDAMTIDRPYRAAISLEAAYEEIIANRGTAYDPAMVQIFEDVWRSGKIQEIWAAWHTTQPVEK